MKNNQPNFFIVGASKCGTTALAKGLGFHPEIYMSSIKEPNFFNKFESSESKIHQEDLASYLNHFKSAKNEPIIGEASVNYLSSLNSAHWISQFFPNAKILIVVRNPLARTRSMYEMIVRSGYNKSFQHAIETDGFLVKQNFYFDNVNRYLSVFPKGQVMVVLHEDLLTEWQATVKSILAFLEVDTSFQVSRIEKNLGGIPRNRIFKIATNRSLINFSERLLSKAGVEFFKNLIRKTMFKRIELSESQINYLKGKFKGDLEKLDCLLGLKLSKKWLDL